MNPNQELDNKTQKSKWKYKSDRVETKPHKDAKWRTNAQLCIEKQ
jgi:hypothetical protein